MCKRHRHWVVSLFKDKTQALTLEIVKLEDAIAIAVFMPA